MPDYCEITGTLRKPEQNALAADAAIHIHRASKAGTNLVIIPFRAISDDLGVVTFRVPKACTIYVSGRVDGLWKDSSGNRYNEDNPKALAVPDADTATLESLIAVAAVADEGLTVKANGSALANLQGTFDFSSRFALTESPASEINIELAASGVAAGIYTSANITVDSFGRVTAAANGSGGGGVWGSIGGDIADQADLIALVGAQLTQAEADALYSAIGHDHAGVYEPVLGFTAVPDTRTINGHALSGNVTVTAADVGLGNVENAAASALYSVLAHNHSGVYEPANANIQSHISSSSNPHSVTAAQVGAAQNANVAFTGPTQARSYALPDAAATLAALGIAQTWSAAQTFGSGILMASGQVIASASGPLTLNVPAGSQYSFRVGGGDLMMLSSGNLRPDTSLGLDLGRSDKQWNDLFIGGGARVDDSATSIVVNALRVRHESSGTPAVGFGTGLLFQGKSSTTSNQDMSQMCAEWEVATHASRTSLLRIKLVNAAAALADALKIKADTRLFIGCPNSAPTDADIANNFFTAYLDESLNTLNFRVRYSDGSYKTGAVALT